VRPYGGERTDKRPDTAKRAPAKRDAKAPAREPSRGRSGARTVERAKPAGTQKNKNAAPKRGRR